MNKQSNICLFLSAAIICLTLSKTLNSETKLLPHIEFEGTRGHAFEGKIKKSISFKNNTIKTLPVYKVIDIPVSIEWFEKFARDNFGITGKIRVDKFEVSDVYNIISDNWILQYFTGANPGVVLENKKYYGPDAVTNDMLLVGKFPSRKECQNIAVEAMKKFGLTENDMYMTKGKPETNSHVFKGRMYLSIGFDRILDGYLIVGSDAFVRIARNGDIIKIQTRWEKLERGDEYPLRSPEEAFKAFSEGQGRIQGMASEEQIFKVHKYDIIYYASLDDKDYVQPVYRFCGEKLDGNKKENKNNYDKCGYVEAIDVKYYVNE